MIINCVIVYEVQELTNPFPLRIEYIVTSFLHTFVYLCDKGYIFVFNGENVKFYGTIALISADNQASSAFDRFNERSSAYCFCRQCLSTADENKEIVS